jgi:hypothetical protein
MGTLEPGTDLYAAVLKIAPIPWDVDLEDPATDTYLRQLAVEFPGWHPWRPPSPDGGEPWWGARDGHTVIITSTGAELRAALEHHRATGHHPLSAEVFFLERRGAVIVGVPAPRRPVV